MAAEEWSGEWPIALTQNDEVAFPVAVYNYLKGPQTVKLDLQPEPWFELVDGLGLSRSIALKANEVTSVKFRIRAKNFSWVVYLMQRLILLTPCCT